jgi:hypothetical protein
MKRPLILFFIALGFLLLLLKFIGYYHKEDEGIIGFFGRLLNKTNSFEVTYDNVKSKDIDILWSSEEVSKTLVKKGKSISNFGYAYGPERFTIIYKDTVLFTHSFFSENNNEVYEVEINISKVPSGLTVTSSLDNHKNVTRFDNSRNILDGKR